MPLVDLDERRRAAARISTGEVRNGLRYVVSGGIPRRMLPDAKHGFVFLPRRWVAERSLGWLARFRRVTRDYEPLSEAVQGLHVLAHAILLGHRFVQVLAHAF
jgi:transposase